VLAQNGLSVDHVRTAPPVATLQGFVENRGQWDEEVLFFARQGVIEATLTRDALVFRPMSEWDSDRDQWLPRPAPLVLHFPGRAGGAVAGVGELPTLHHFIRSHRSASNVPSFGQVVYRDVAPGIDIVLRRDAESFAYDIHAAPGADIESLVIEVEGAERLTIVGGTVLAMDTAAGRVEHRLGASWQLDPMTGERVPVTSSFRELPAATSERLRFGLQVQGRDSEASLVIDPSLVFATYVGGTGQDFLKDMFVAPDGSVYLTALTFFDAPTTPGSFQPTWPGSLDVWLAKLSADGTTLEWGTWLGGSDVDDPFGIEVDSDGSVVVAGNSWSDDLPTTAGSLQPLFGGTAGQNSDVFISRFTADGSALVWSTFYGEESFEKVTTTALFPSGDVLVAGKPKAASPPATPGAFDTVFESGKQYLVRITANGTQLVFQTYLKSGTIRDLVIDVGSNIYLSGDVLAADGPFPTTPGVFMETMDPGDSSNGFIAKMDGMGSLLHWGTYLGGDTNTDLIAGLGVDSSGAVYVTGTTSSTDFPVTAGAFDTEPGSSGAFATKLLPYATGLVWSTFITAVGSGSTNLHNLVVDSAGNLLASGAANEPNYPVTPDAFQPNYIGPAPSSADAVLTKFGVFGEALIYSTYFGGNGGDTPRALGHGVDQDPVMAMFSGSTSIPVTPGAFDSTYAGGGGDIVVAKFDLDVAPWRVMGGGLKGTVDVPNLAGSGDLLPGSFARVSLRGAAPLSQSFLVVGLLDVSLPFKGGTLVPSPDVLLPIGSNAQGAFDLLFQWVGVPAGLDVYVQTWIQDPGAVSAWSASNALQMMSQ